MAHARLQTRDLGKDYPGTVALDRVSVGFAAGQVHALIGKNGAGKSTLIKILSGATAPSRGEVLLDGRPLRFRSPRDAQRQGIATVYQELSLIPELSVAENILLGRLPRRRGALGWLVDWPATYERADAVLQEMQTRIDVRRRVGALSVAEQQIVEIAKAMSHRPAALMLDEPTSALARREVDRLFELIRRLAAQDVAIVYISHRLHELPAIADCVTALRDGRHAGTIPIAEATPATIVQTMFGEAVQTHRPTDLAPSSETVLAVRDLSLGERLDGVSLRVGRGEVLGIAGMLGSGRTELLEAIFGARRVDSGTIRVQGRPVDRPSPARMKRLGVGLAPEDRKRQGLVLLLSTRDNLCLASLHRIARRGWIWRKLQRRVAERNVLDLQIRVADIGQSVAALSGGNQQKVVVANWLNTEPRVLLFDEPSRGIDVQAKQQIFEIIWDLSRRGVASIIVSSELEELLELCTRIVVLRGGRIIAEASPEAITLAELMATCMGEQAS